MDILETSDRFTRTQLTSNISIPTYKFTHNCHNIPFNPLSDTNESLTKTYNVSNQQTKRKYEMKNKAT